MNTSTPTPTHTNAQGSAAAATPESASPETSLNPAVIAARSALQELGKLGLLEQCEASRVEVDIGGVKTFWNRGLMTAHPFMQVERGEESILSVWNASDSTLHIFKRGVGTSYFERVETVTKHSAIFARLPRYAFVPGASAIPASFAQLVVLRKLLRLDPNAAIPDLHIASATRLIGLVVLEPVLDRLMAGRPELRAQPNAAQAAGAAA